MSFPDAPEEAFLVENLLRVLAQNPGRRQFVVPLGFPVRLICGLRGTIKKNDLDRDAPIIKLTLLVCIFILRCGRLAAMYD